MEKLGKESSMIVLSVCWKFLKHESLQTSDCFCLCSTIVQIVDSLFSISSAWLLSTHLSFPPSSSISPRRFLLRICAFTTDKNQKGILHFKAVHPPPPPSISLN